VNTHEYGFPCIQGIIYFKALVPLRLCPQKNKKRNGYLNRFRSQFLNNVGLLGGRNIWNCKN